MKKETEFKVTKCICYDTTFQEMKNLMKKNNAKTLKELQEIKTVAANCQLCLPYIKKMIDTGEVEFDLIIQ